MSAVPITRYARVLVVAPLAATVLSLATQSQTYAVTPHVHQSAPEAPGTGAGPGATGGGQCAPAGAGAGIGANAGAGTRGGPVACSPSAGASGGGVPGAAGFAGPGAAGGLPAEVPLPTPIRNCPCPPAVAPALPAARFHAMGALFVHQSAPESPGTSTSGPSESPRQTPTPAGRPSCPCPPI